MSWCIVTQHLHAAVLHARAGLKVLMPLASSWRAGSPGRSSLPGSVPVALRRQLQAATFGSVPVALPL
eukprot:7067834-Alexandrium_andersonii.AAC.1